MVGIHTSLTVGLDYCPVTPGFQGDLVLRRNIGLILGYEYLHRDSGARYEFLYRCE
jgi:hypothetical protein